MGEVIRAPMIIKLDASEAVQKIEEEIELLKLPSGSFEGVPEHVIDLLLCRISSLFDNVVLRYVPPAIGTGYINEITIKVEIVGSLDEFTSAIGAVNFQRTGAH
ncbi:hypothetical protein ACXQAU_002740 [Citrobacter freundii]